jgi:hypothetical protein
MSTATTGTITRTDLEDIRWVAREALGLAVCELEAGATANKLAVLVKMQERAWACGLVSLESEGAPPGTDWHPGGDLERWPFGFGAEYVLTVLEGCDDVEDDYARVMDNENGDGHYAAFALPRVERARRVRALLTEWLEARSLSAPVDTADPWALVDDSAEGITDR